MKTTTPFGLIRRLNDDIERMFDEFNLARPFTLTRPLARKFDWMPAIEVLEKDKALVVRAELPGMNRDDIKIDVTDRVLTLQGERKQEHEEKRDDYVVTERSYGSFYREIALPEGAKADEAAATFKNGLLEIRVPVAEKKLPGVRRLPIAAAEEEKVPAAV